ncbi:MAG: NADH-quinone oxidoreductase subunit E [Planctomycetota bacterium]|jgi:NADH-quinone oxidoreductase subunit E
MLPDTLILELDELSKNYPVKRAALIPALHRIQEEMGGWISPESMELCAEYFEMEPVDVYGVVTFYPMFYTKPVGKYVVGVCRNISCDLRGAGELLESVEKATKCRAGQSSEDGNFTVEVLECQGACTDAPMLVLNGAYHENLDPERVEQLIGELN